MVRLVALMNTRSHILANAMTLRRKSMELVYQELWGPLLGYNLIRREASQAAVAHQRAPSGVSFKFACQFIAIQLVVMAGAMSPAHTPRRLAELRGSIGCLFTEKRPRPSRPRTVICLIPSGRHTLAVHVNVAGVVP